MKTDRTIYDFSKSDTLQKWYVVDDGVMGGVSQGELSITEDGHARFTGTISLDNNGGFSSIRYNLETIDSSKFSKVVITLKGDGKDYQFRLKEDDRQRHSYIYTFTTTGQWQTIEIPFKDFKPAFRGRDLAIPNFSGAQIEEIAFLIGNKRNESFELLIDKISIEL